MPKVNLGTKRACRKCNANFYDLNKDPIECPKCLTTFSANDFMSKYVKGSDKDRKESKKAPTVFEEEEVLIDPETIDEGLLDDDEEGLLDGDVELDDTGMKSIALKDEDPTSHQ